MEKFTALLEKFENMGEKTGWTYITIPAKTAIKLNPENKKSFRVKGKLDQYAIHQVALIPMGEGDYIMAINATMRKGIRKNEGATIVVQIEQDNSELEVSPDLVACLKEDKAAWKQFESLATGHQRYFSNWIESAKTQTTKADRIAKCLFAMQEKMDYGEMIRYFKARKN
ncbi:MAG: DUF1905 domain-containing protein [Flavobacteriales bacterium]